MIGAGLKGAMEAMGCEKCGESLGIAAKFCSSCGAKVKAISPMINAATGEVEQETTADTAKRYAKIAADEVVDAGRSALKTRLGKEMAIGAAAGAVIAIPIPIIGPLAGAAIGSGIVFFRRYWKD